MEGRGEHSNGLPQEELAILEGMFRDGLNLSQVSGLGGAPPADKEVIKRLKLSLWREGRNTEKDCAICQEDYQDKDKMMAMPCDHLFHKDCLTTWLGLRNTCPSCRKVLNIDTEKPLYDYYA